MTVAELARLRASPAVRLLRMGGRAALFCERRQQLFELSAEALGHWHATLAGRESPYADAWVEAGLLLPDLPAGPLREQGLQLAGMPATLCLDPADPLWPELDATFGQFAAPVAGPRLTLARHAGGYLLIDDAAPRGRFAPDRIVPEVKAVLTDRLAKAVGQGAFLLHAALLADAGRGLLITGPPGAGKTTLTLALAARGLAYASDDIVHVAPDGRLTGVPFAPAAKAGAWDLLALPPGPAHLRADGQHVRYLPGPPAAPVDRLGWCLILDRRPVARATLEPVEPLAMLTELLASALSADRALSADTLDAFAAQVAAADCRRLVYADLDEGAAAVEVLVRG